MIDITTARQRVTDYLHQAETDMDVRGAALPGYKGAPNLHVVIVDEQEYEFGWVFIYSAREFIDSGDISAALVGNAPLVFDRNDGHLYVTGTAFPLEHYIEEYRNGARRRAE